MPQSPSNGLAALEQPIPALLVALLFLILAGIYSILNPLFESPDEIWHYPFVWHLARTGQLPLQDPARPQLWAQEGSQPPLYYALAAVLTAAVPADDLPDLIYPNPHADIGLVSPDGNANIIVHTRREQWPWRGAVLAARLSRLVSLLLGTGTVLAVYSLGRILQPERPALALLAMAFVAFNPMFIYISASINNDNLIILLAALSLRQLAILLTKNTTGRLQSAAWGVFIKLGLLAGLASLTKVSGLGLVGLTGLTLLVWGINQRAWRVAIASSALVGLLTLTIAGWWYWRNFALYGDWSGTQNMVAMMGARPITPTGAQLLAEGSGLIRSFWGLFGYFSIPLPEPIYGLLNLTLLLGLVGYLRPMLTKERRIPPRLRRSWPILAGWMGLMIIGLIQWTLRTPASQGRLLFPALPALAILWAGGWQALFPTRAHYLPALGMLLLASWVPFGVIVPAYARPEPVDRLPPSVQTLNVTFDQDIRLLGVEPAQPVAVKPGQTLSLRFFWQSGQPLEKDYSVFLHLLDEHDLIIAQRNVFHGPGVYPTSQWISGQIFSDSYSLRLPGTAFAPDQARFELGLYDHLTGERLITATGQDSARFGQVILQPQPGQLPNSQDLLFEEGIALMGYTLDRRRVAVGETVTLTLYWQGRGQPSRNYKVFVHLVGSDDRRAAQHDSEPQNGQAPTTSWQSGQVVSDPHPLTITPDAPPGAYRLTVGLYDGQNGQRLRLLSDSGRSVQTNVVTLSGIRVVAAP